MFLRKIASWIASFFPSFEPLISDTSISADHILSQLHTLPKDYLDPDIVAIAQAVCDNNIPVLLGYVNSFREIGEITVEKSILFKPKFLGTVCLIELSLIVNDNNEAIVAEIMACDGLAKIKEILREDKEVSHTYWTLVFLSALCEKEESINEPLVHIQMEEIFLNIIKKHSEQAPGFHILIHQLLGHMIMAEKSVRKFYCKSELYLSIVPLIDCNEYAIVQTALSVLSIVLISDDENDEDGEYIKNALKEIPIESNLKEVTDKLNLDPTCPSDQRESILKLCEQVLKFIS